MNNEKYGIDLEVNTKTFKDKINEMKTRIVDFGKTAKENFNNGMNIDINAAKSRLDELQSKFNELKPFSNLTSSRNEMSNISNEIVELKKVINSIETSKISKLGQLFNSLKEKTTKVKMGSDEFSNSLSKTFNNGIKSIKRFALSLFGIQSIWRAVSRASSAYMSKDAELANKMQAVWVGLGSMLAPIIEKIANGLLKIVSYVNAFVKGLTGVDLLANAMNKVNKSTKSTSKSVKALKGQLGGLDEINNISDNGSSSGGSNVNYDWTSAFNNVQIDTAWAEKLQSFGSWFKENWEIIALGIGTLTLVIGGLNIASTLASVGLTGLAIPFVAIALAIGGLISLVLGIVELFKEGGNETKAWTLILGGLVAIVIAVGLAFGAIPMAIAALVAAVVADVLWVIKNWDDVKEAISKGCKKVAEWFKGLWEDIKNIFGKVTEWFTEKFGDAFSGIKKVFSGCKQYFSGIKDVFVGIFTLDKNKICTGLKNVIAGVGNIIMGFIEGVINGFLIPINGAISLINKIPGVSIPKLHVTMPKFPQLATGTNFVPNDQLAYIHKGEAVVPKKFNSEEYFGRGNDETNALLKDLIEIIEEKDNSVYLDGKKISNTVQRYMNYQDRVMGRGVN